MSFPLEEYAQVVLDGNGNGAVQVGPKKDFQTWQIDAVAVHVSSNVKEPTFKIFRGSSTAITSFVDGTYAGSFDSNTTFNRTLPANGKFTCVWENGDAGATATVTFSGTVIE